MGWTEDLSVTTNNLQDKIIKTELEFTLYFDLEKGNLIKMYEAKAYTRNQI